MNQLNAVVFVVKLLVLLLLLLLLVLLKLVLFSIVIQCSLVKLLDVHEHDETESSSIIIQSIVWVFLMGNSINSIESIAFLSLLFFLFILILLLIFFCSFQFHFNFVFFPKFIFSMKFIPLLNINYNEFMMMMISSCFDNAKN